MLARPGADIVPLLRYALGVIAARARTPPARTVRGCSPLCGRTNRRWTAGWRRQGFDAIAVVTLLMKETLVRVAEPRLVPAGVR